MLPSSDAFLRMYDRDSVIEKCEQRGIYWARANLEYAMTSEASNAMKEWIDKYESTEKAASEALQLQLSRETVEAVKTSAQAAVESAKHARSSARATTWAVGVAVIAAVAAIAQAVAGFVAK